MSDREILNCGQHEAFSFTYRCPVKWSDLEETDTPLKRHCSQCAKPVYFCHDVIEAGIRAAQNECIAISARLAAATREAIPEGVIAVGQGPSPRDLLERGLESLSTDGK